MTGLELTGLEFTFSSGTNTDDFSSGTNTPCFLNFGIKTAAHRDKAGRSGTFTFGTFDVFDVFSWTNSKYYKWGLGLGLGLWVRVGVGLQVPQR